MANRSLPISFTENLQLSSVGIQVRDAGVVLRGA